MTREAAGIFDAFAEQGPSIRQDADDEDHFTEICNFIQANLIGNALTVTRTP